MPLIVLDDLCPLCGRGFAAGEDAFAAFGMFPAGELARYCTAAIHWDCYLGWGRRGDFARAAAAAWKVRVAEGREFHPVLDHPAVHVCVRTDAGGRGEVVLLLKELGYDLRIDLSDWDWWLKLTPTGVHAGVASAWAAVRDAVRAALPSAAMIRGNYPPLPAEHVDDLEYAGDRATFSEAVRKERWKEVLALEKEGLQETYSKRLIEYVSYYPDDQTAVERLRNERPWVDKFLFAPRPLSAHREAGFLWAIQFWHKPGRAEWLAAADVFLARVVAELPDTRAAAYAQRLRSKWGLGTTAER
jgi:hypothetical protein